MADDDLPNAPMFLAAGQRQTAQGVFIIGAAPSGGEAPDGIPVHIIPRRYDFARIPTRMTVPASGTPEEFHIEDTGGADEVCISPTGPVFITVGARTADTMGGMFLPPGPHIFQCDQELWVHASSANGEECFVTVNLVVKPPYTPA